MQLSKNDSLALKGIAILMMYVHHFYLSPDRWAGYAVDFFPLTADMTVYIAEFFKTCVCIFVFIINLLLLSSVIYLCKQMEKLPSFRQSAILLLLIISHFYGNV